MLKFLRNILGAKENEPKKFKDLKAGDAIYVMGRYDNCFFKTRYTPLAKRLFFILNLPKRMRYIIGGDTFMVYSRMDKYDLNLSIIYSNDSNSNSSYPCFIFADYQEFLKWTKIRLSKKAKSRSRRARGILMQQAVSDFLNM